MTATASLIVVEDDREIGPLLKDLLGCEGYDVRLARSGATRFRFDRFVLDVDARRLFENEKEIELSTGDFDLLSVFIHAPHRVLSRDQLMDMTKGRNWEAFDRSIDVALSRLRRKIERAPSQPVIIKTIRNAGYLFATSVTKV
jgi:two-component system OmpR family response regulator